MLAALFATLLSCNAEATDSWTLTQYYAGGSVGMFYTINNSADGTLIRQQKYRMLCINDMGLQASQEEFEQARDRINDAFESILPEKSSFEI